MVNVVKSETNIRNIYTYFEFKGYDGWDEFDILLSVLTNQMGYMPSGKIEGIYSKHCTLEKDGFTFKLMHHEDFGNCLCSQEEKDSDYYSQLEEVAVGTLMGLKAYREGL